MDIIFHLSSQLSQNVQIIINTLSRYVMFSLMIFNAVLHVCKEDYIRMTVGVKTPMAGVSSGFKIFLYFL